MTDEIPSLSSRTHSTSLRVDSERDLSELNQHRSDRSPPRRTGWNCWIAALIKPALIVWSRSARRRGPWFDATGDLRSLGGVLRCLL